MPLFLSSTCSCMACTTQAQMVGGNVRGNKTIRSHGATASSANGHKGLDAAEAEKQIHRLPPDERRVRYQQRRHLVVI